MMLSVFLMLSCYLSGVQSVSTTHYKLTAATAGTKATHQGTPYSQAQYALIDKCVMEKTIIALIQKDSGELSIVCDGVNNANQCMQHASNPVPNQLQGFALPLHNGEIVSKLVCARNTGFIITKESNEHNYDHATVSKQRVFGWGSNANGILGINSTVSSVNVPTELTFPKVQWTRWGASKNEIAAIKDVVCGLDVCFAQLQDSSWTSWGGDRDVIRLRSVSSNAPVGIPSFIDTATYNAEGLMQINVGATSGLIAMNVWGEVLLYGYENEVHLNNIRPSSLYKLDLSNILSSRDERVKKVFAFPRGLAIVKREITGGQYDQIYIVGDNQHFQFNLENTDPITTWTKMTLPLNNIYQHVINMGQIMAPGTGEVTTLVFFRRYLYGWGHSWAGASIANNMDQFSVLTGGSVAGYIYESQGSCYNIPSTDPDVCSGHGTCDVSNRCKCDQGYYGSTCQGRVPTCSSTSSNSLASVVPYALLPNGVYATQLKAYNNEDDHLVVTSDATSFTRVFKKNDKTRWYKYSSTSGNYNSQSNVLGSVSSILGVKTRQKSVKSGSYIGERNVYAFYDTSNNIIVGDQVSSTYTNRLTTTSSFEIFPGAWVYLPTAVWLCSYDFSTSSVMMEAYNPANNALIGRYNITSALSDTQVIGLDETKNDQFLILTTVEAIYRFDTTTQAVNRLHAFSEHREHEDEAIMIMSASYDRSVRRHTTIWSSGRALEIQIDEDTFFAVSSSHLPVRGDAYRVAYYSNPSSSLAGTCSNHGWCDNFESISSCTCQPGYKGSFCGDMNCPTQPQTKTVLIDEANNKIMITDFKTPQVVDKAYSGAGVLPLPAGTTGSKLASKWDGNMGFFRVLTTTAGFDNVYYSPNGSLTYEYEVNATIVGMDVDLLGKRLAVATFSSGTLTIKIFDTVANTLVNTVTLPSVLFFVDMSVDNHAHHLFVAVKTTSNANALYRYSSMDGSSRVSFPTFNVGAPLGIDYLHEQKKLVVATPMGLYQWNQTGNPISMSSSYNRMGSAGLIGRTVHQFTVNEESGQQLISFTDGSAYMGMISEGTWSIQMNFRSHHALTGNDRFTVSTYDGQALTPEQVCFGHGSCTAIDTCTCTDFYQANTNCSTRPSVCFNLAASDPSVCAGHGTCANDVCTCSAGYHGPNCNSSMCYGNVNGMCVHGSCGSPDTCTCETGYHGPMCAYTTGCDVGALGSKIWGIKVGMSRILSYRTPAEVATYSYTGYETDLSVMTERRMFTMYDHTRLRLIFYGKSSGTPAGSTTLFPYELRTGALLTQQHVSQDCATLQYGDTEDRYICLSTSGNNVVVTKLSPFAHIGTTQFQVGFPGEVFLGHGISTYANGVLYFIANIGDKTSIHALQGSTLAGQSYLLDSRIVVAMEYNGNTNEIHVLTSTNILKLTPQLGLIGDIKHVLPTNLASIQISGISYDRANGIWQIPMSGAKLVAYNPVHNGLVKTPVDVPTWSFDYSAVYLEAQSGSAAPCQSRGTCNTTCSCVPAYSGATCGDFTCYGLTGASACGGTSRGSCSNYDSCGCINGHTGNQCQFAQCHGVSGDNPSACSGHGSCFTTNVCTCTDTSLYNGTTCTPVCYGVTQGYGVQCSGHGTCVAPNSCSCVSNYGGSQCETFTCNGVASTDPNTCSGHGSCNAHDTCSCASGSYTGSFCESWTCHGIANNNGSVCSSHGTCSDVDTCGCTLPYYGTTCGNHSCFGVDFTNPQVCSGHGICGTPNVCTCLPGYTGANCEHNICFGLLSNDTANVCSNHGSCVAPDACNCTTGYTDHNCARWFCNGILNNDTSVCSNSNGTCTSYDTCACNPGYSGANCEHFTCHGVGKNDSSVCSGRGSCTQLEKCECQLGYIGSNCEYRFCSGVLNNETHVCSGNGNCTAFDTCECTPGLFTGHNCEIPICFGVPANESNTCTGHGICNNNHTCTCGPSFIGYQCEINEPCSAFTTNFPYCNVSVCDFKREDDPAVCNYRNGTCLPNNFCNCSSLYHGSICQYPTCGGINHDNAAVCNHGNGTCVAPNKCVCSPQYNGTNCELPICFGKSAGDACYNRNGVRPHGFCAAPDSCSCLPGHFGPNCEFTTCNSINSTDANVCSGKGKCDTLDYCICELGYFGANCELSSLCGGFQSFDPAACSGRGKCIINSQNVGECHCGANAQGVNCETWTCGGIAATEATACSGHGSCSGNDTCSCQAGYAGKYCQDLLCNGIAASNSSVCTGHGKCTGINKCECAIGYTQTFCTSHLCNTIDKSDPSVCSSHGTCVAADSCVCSNASYTGSNCETHMCAGVPSNSPGVCSGHGRCTYPETCACNLGFTGDACDRPTCKQIDSNSSSVCSGHGTCTATDTCACQTGYTGADCEFAICHGVSAQQFGSVCTNGQGKCTAPDTCSCLTGYVGSKCEQKTCYGILSNDSSVCSSHGTCIAYNACQCNTGYGGNSCNEVTCKGVVASDSTVCSSRGACTGIDTCSCFGGYAGEQCDKFSGLACNGFIYNDTKVCSGRGSCTAPDKCECTGGWSGSNCETPTCTPECVKGDCTNINTCTCYTNFYGSSCANYSCYGIDSSSPSVCSGSSCIAPDVCQCPSGYTGNCTIPICYGIAGNLPNVCSGKGTCTSPNTCSCGSYTGIQCEFQSCFGYSNTDSRVCSSHGTCNDINNCTCATGYIGNECQTPTCNGLSGASACSAHGTCSGLNNCSCNAGYTGTNCEHAICHSFLSNDIRVCSGHGTCGSPETCTCATGYTGDKCQYAICNGTDASQANVCSGHGTCAAPDTCTCQSGYVGDICNDWSCGIYKKDDPLACSGTNGTCVGFDTCSCVFSDTEGHYYGSECEICALNYITEPGSSIPCNKTFCGPATCSYHGTCDPVTTSCSCNGHYDGSYCEKCATNYYQSDCNTFCEASSTCSGHGACNTNGSCVCSQTTNGMWTGADCNSCVAGYHGPTCSCNADSTCSGHGSCNAQGTCDCSTGWDGAACDTCAYGYFTATCIIACTATVNCSNHGYCIETGACKCDADDVKGHFNGTFCNTCIEGYYGPSCRISWDDVFTLNAQGNGLTGKISYPYPATSIDCATLIHPDDHRLIGDLSFSRCYWPNRPGTTLDRDFVLEFGSAATARPNDKVRINIAPLYNGTTPEYHPISIVLGSSFPTPTAKVNGKTTIGACEGLTLDGSESSSPDLRSLKFSWRATSGSGIAITNQFLSTQTGSIVDIPVDSILAAGSGSPFTIELSVTNDFGIVSSVSHTFIKLSVPTLGVKIEGGSVRTTYAKAPFKLFGTPKAAEPCFLERYSETRSLYQWTQVSGPTDFRGNITISNEGRQMFFDNVFPLVATTYKFRFTVTALANNIPVSDFVTVNVLLSPIQALIEGGKFKEVNVAEDFFIDGSSSVDPDGSSELEEFKWKCVDRVYGGFCIGQNSTSTAFLQNLPSTKNVTIPANYLVAGAKYKIVLTWAKGTRVSTDAQEIDTYSNVKPVVTIKAIPKTVNSNKMLTLEGASNIDKFASVYGIPANSTRVYSWSYSGQAPLSSIALSSLNRPKIGIGANTLVRGETLLFTLSSWVVGYESIVSTSIVTTRVNSPPRPGSCSAQPEGLSAGEIAVAGNTTFKIICDNWYDVDVPLRYSFVAKAGNVTKQLSLRPLDVNKLFTTIPVAGIAPNYTVTLVATVFDQFDGSTPFEVNIQVKPLNVSASEAASMADNLINNLNATGGELTTGEMLSNLEVISGLIETSSNGTNTGSGGARSIFAIEQQKKNTNLRSTVIDYVSTSVGGDVERDTKESLSKVFDLVGSVSSKPTEITDDASTKLANVLSKKASSFTPEVLTESSTAKSVLSAINNVQNTALTGPSSTDSSGGFAPFQPNARSLIHQNSIVDSASGATNSLLNALATNQFEGAPPTIIDGGDTKVGVFKEQGDLLSNTSVAVGSISVSIPGALGSSVGAGESLQTQIKTSAKNPHVTSSANVTSEVLDISFKSTSGAKKSSLPEPLVFVLPGTFAPNKTSDIPHCNATELSDCPQYQVTQCKYWIASDSSGLKTTNAAGGWSTTGCTVVDVNTTHITCSCTHTTSFSAIVEYATPDLNLPDYRVFVTLNADNITSLIVMSSLFVAYVTLLVLLELLKMSKTEHDKVLPEQHPSGYIRPTWERFKKSHIWLSNFFTPQFDTNFTRSQRITVVYMAVLGMFLSGAMVYGVKQENQVQVLAASLISDLVSWPIVAFFTTMFLAIGAPKEKREIAALFNPDQETPWDHLANTENKIDRLLKERSNELKNESVNVWDDLQNNNVLSINEAANDLLNIDYDELVPEVNASSSDETDDDEVENDESSASSTHNSSTHVSSNSSSQRTSSKRLNQDPSQTYLSTQIADEPFMDIFRRRLVTLVDALDYFIDMVYVKFMNLLLKSRFVGFLLISVMTIGVCVGVSILCLILSYQVAWLPSWCVAIVAVAILIAYILFLELLYIATKNRQYQLIEDMQWRTTKSSIVTVISCVILIGIFISVSVLFPSLQFAVFKSQDWPLSVVVDASMLVLTICVIAFAVHHFRVPHKMSKEEKIAKEEEKKQRKKVRKLPNWVKYIVYVLAWGWIGFASVTAVAFGIQFDNIQPGYATDWIISSFTACGQNCFVSKPLSFIVKLVCLTTVTQMFEGLFTGTSIGDVIDLDFDLDID